MNTAHRLADGFRSVIGYWTPTPTVSQFLEKGTLTPQEFVEAGDQLAFKFPTWKWQSAEGRRQVSWLPANKQYLVTYGVACRSRVRDLDNVLAKSSCEPYEVDDATSSSWFLPFCPNEELNSMSTEQKHSDFRSGNSTGSGTGVSQTHIQISSSGIGTPGDVLCFSDIDDILCEEEEETTSVFLSPKGLELLEDVPNDMKTDLYRMQCYQKDGITVTGTRSYDLSVTYDKYYQTPRLWLKGYDEQGLPLDSSQIFEDILTEYISKTVTIDAHPCTGEFTVSIHPCRHASMMKKVIDGWLSHNVKPRHDLALIVLLKFISSVIPTIQYDTTLDIDGFLAALHHYPSRGSSSPSAISFDRSKKQDPLWMQTMGQH